MTERRSIWQWATEYTGDPESWQRRGEIIRDFLIENEMQGNSAVLEIGCGNLSTGVRLIEYLDHGQYVGVDPAGWLVEAALQAFPTVEARRPTFLWRDDFDASELDRKFDFIVAHSVLSHCAHWQLGQMLANTRKVAHPGTVFLASYREDQFNTLAKEWRYPDVTYFRLRSIMAAGFEFGWEVEPMPDYRERLMAECPNDIHQWVRMKATETNEELNARHRREEEYRNDLRLEEERANQLNEQMRDQEEASRLAIEQQQDDARITRAGMIVRP